MPQGRSMVKKQRSRKSNMVFDGVTFDISRKTYIMGILNVTPDSFYDGGKYMGKEKALGHAVQMVKDGADMIDIGGQSTRPGSRPVSADEELDRVIPVIESVSEAIQVPISIDTFNHVVAEEALKRGASIVNDVTALRGDEYMAGIVSRYDAGLVLMHMKGLSSTMQENPVYEDVVGDIIEYLRGSIEIADKGGISGEKIVVDPGIGFGKTAEHNLILLNRLKEFEVLERPILVGVSRKSFIGTILERDTEDRLMGTSAACAIAIANGANILRVHDVKEMKEIAKVADAIRRERVVV